MGDSSPVLPSILPERYQIERLIGRGGMAAVYLARDRKHDRLVAVKVLDADLSRTVGAERFQREIEIVAGLTHPHILPLHDSGEAGGSLYYVMPFVAGETLRDKLRREKQLPLEDALRITCEVASALDYAHRHGILHRDIKPENILLEDGHAILADFGIARALGSAGDTRMTATGMTLGTPAYMSPEQSSGEREPDTGSDLYSLASVLYEMLAGEPPFTGPTAQTVIAKRLGNPPPRIRAVRASVPEALERALLRGLDPVPADRFASAAIFREALETCARDMGRPAVRLSRRTLAAAAAALLFAILAAGWALRPRGATDALTTIAILPLVNTSANPEHAFLAEGLTDAIITDLVGVSGIRVISRMSVMRYAAGMGTEMSGDAAMAGNMPGTPMAANMPVMPPGGMSYMDPTPGGGGDAGNGDGAMGGMGAPKTLAQIARELGADVLLQGNLVREGDTVRVAASLVRAPALTPIWEGSYARHVRELFALQRDLVAAITSASVGRGASHEVQAGAAREYDPAAHEAYLKGAYYQAHWRLPQAVESFERAVQLDPTHAMAQAGLSRAYYFLAFFGEMPPSIALGGMRRAATAALDRDSLVAEAHAQLALVKMLQDWDWDGAERSFRRALELAPGHAQIRHDYAHFLLGQGRQQESMEQTRHAVALDPVNPMLISCLGWHSLFDARFDDAARHAIEANAMMPDHWAQVVLGWALIGQGKTDSALVAFREARRLRESAFTLAALGYGLAASGRDVEARRVLDELLERVEREYVSPYDIATVYAGLGDADGAFRWLRRAAEDRSTFIVHVGWDARFDRVRQDARFADLTTREMRLPAPRFASLSATQRQGM